MGIKQNSKKLQTHRDKVTDIVDGNGRGWEGGGGDK
jgi:hypothetical protein